jgi:hypothetical protein
MDQLTLPQTLDLLHPRQHAEPMGQEIADRVPAQQGAVQYVGIRSKEDHPIDAA